VSSRLANMMVQCHLTSDRRFCHPYSLRPVRLLISLIPNKQSSQTKQDHTIVFAAANSKNAQPWHSRQRRMRGRGWGWWPLLLLAALPLLPLNVLLLC
jgi:hypothetical protein